MPDRVVQTGVTLRHSREQPSEGGVIQVSAEVWAELLRDGAFGPERVGGNFAYGEVMLGEDPTRALMELAHEQREMNLGSILGDLRIRGADVTRFECYAAPFRVELDDQLRELLSGTWDGRDPRP